MAQFIIETVERLGYLGLLGLMFLENVFPPLPSELVMPFAGMASARKESLSFVGVVVAGTVGSVLGAVVHYYVGACIDAEKLRGWAERYGHWIGFDAEDLDKARGWFGRHGATTVLFGRLIPGVRSMVSIPAGMERMHFGQFLLYSTLGSAVWTALLAGAGRLLGSHYQKVERFLDPVTWTILGVMTLLWVVRMVQKQSDRRMQRRQTA